MSFQNDIIVDGLASLANSLIEILRYFQKSLKIENWTTYVGVELREHFEKTEHLASQV